MMRLHLDTTSRSSLETLEMNNDPLRERAGGCGLSDILTSSSSSSDLPI